MVSQATVDAKVSYGFARAAAALGADCPWFRACGAGNPLLYRVGTMKAGFQGPNTAYTAPSNYTKPSWWGLFDTSSALPGDYLLEPRLGAFFIASIEPLHYPLCISCNTVLTLTRPTDPAPGAGYYGGDSMPETALATSWPASVLNGTKGEKSDLNLPGDIRAPWVSILLPASFPDQILTGDVATTDHPTPLRYTISAAELTGLGWRLTASLAVP